jgi:hypothetical protein
MENKFLNDPNGEIDWLLSFKDVINESKWKLRVSERLYEFFRHNLSSYHFAELYEDYKIEDVNLNYLDFSEDDFEKISYSVLSKITTGDYAAVIHLEFPINGINYDARIQLVGDTFEFYTHPNEYIVQFFKENDFRKVGYCKAEVLLSSINTTRVIDCKYFTRTKAKPGKIFKMLMPSATDKEIDYYVSMYKAWSLRHFSPDFLYKFKIVEGKDIAKYYNESNYDSKEGPLGESCMRHEPCQEYLEIYTENPQCKLAILVDESTDKIAARALIWDDKYYDRIYYSVEKVRLLMLSHLMKDDRYQSIHHGKSYMTQSLYDSKSVVIKLDKTNFKKYPFMDSLFLLNTNSNEISNCIGIKPNKVLGWTDGGSDTTGSNYHISNDNLLSYFLGDEQEPDLCCEHCGSNEDVCYIGAYGGDLCSDCYRCCDYTGTDDLYTCFVETYEGNHCHESSTVALVTGEYAYRRDPNITRLDPSYGHSAWAHADDTATPCGEETCFLINDLHYDEETMEYYTESAYEELIMKRGEQEECPECEETSVPINEEKEEEKVSEQQFFQDIVNQS